MHLAVDEDFKDENTGAKTDGIHMGSEGVKRWFAYLKNHVVNESLRMGRMKGFEMLNFKKCRPAAFAALAAL